MTNKQKSYYYGMAKRGRLINLYTNDKNIGLITFFIGNGNVNKYVRENPWSIVDDEPIKGDTCYIDQLLTSKEKINRYASLRVWADIKKYMRDNFKNVKCIRWNRFKHDWGKPKTFKEGL